MASGDQSNTRILIAVGIIAVFGIITFALAAATLGTLNKRFGDLESQIASLRTYVGSFDIKTTTTTQAITTEAATATPTTEHTNNPATAQETTDTNHMTSAGIDPQTSSAAANKP